ncbi:MAG: FAD-binding oxidoreductase [Gemmatimonadales bacterium]
MIERCLWTDAAPHPTRAVGDLPEHADVVVVGAGYTGLAAARALARRGASVVVLERHVIGWGASGRNGGFVLPGYKPDIELLARKLGLDAARRLFRLSLEAVAYLEALVADEKIGCDLDRSGGVTLAARPAHLRALAKSSAFLRRELNYETTVLSATELVAELGSSRYQGGLLDPGAASLHPARYVQGLAAAAERAGARIIQGAEVTRIRSEGAAPRVSLVEISRGVVRAGEVLVATNGYTGAAFPRLRRRVVPVGSYLIATRPLDEALAARLIPRGRVLSDTKNLLYYFRLSPDRRMVFGGRAAFTPTPISRSAEILARAMVEVFPELATTEIEYAWGGQVAFALDQMPHAGRIGGLHYAMGYAGHGVAMSTWLGARVGEKLAGGAELPEITGPLRAVPFYGGCPWFLPLVGGYYRFRDWISRV